MRKNIKIISLPDDYQKVDWFARLLCTRMKAEIPFDANIIYHPLGEVHLPERGINIFLPIRISTKAEISSVFDKIWTNTWIRRSRKDIILDIDLVNFAVWILGRDEERAQKNNRDAWDKHGRFKIERSLAYQKRLCQKPVLDILIVKLIERIEEEFDIDILERYIWGNGRSKAVWLTHDVDKLMGKYVLPVRVVGWIAFGYDGGDNVHHIR